MKRLVTISILTLVVLIPVSGAWGAEYITLGHLTAVSGPGAMWGEGRVGFEQAIEDLNSKGGITVKGKQYLFKGIIYDTKFKPDLAVAGANKLIFDDRVFWLQCMGTAPCLATLPICTENKVIEFHGGYVKELLGPYSFKTMGSKEYYLSLFPYLRKNYPKATRIAMIGLDNDTGKGSFTNCTSAMRLYPDLKFIHTEYYTPGTIDFSSIVMKVLRKKPDVLNLDCSPAEDQGGIIKAARQLGFKGPIMGDCVPDPLRIVEIAGEDFAEGYFYASALLDVTSQNVPPRYKELYEKMVAKYGKKKAISACSVGAPMWYLGVEIIAQAIEQTQSFDPDTLVKYLESHEFDVLSGKAAVKGELTYEIKRQIVHPISVGVIKDGKPVMSEPMGLPEKY